MLIDGVGRILFVTEGIGRPSIWFTAWRTPTGRRRRFTSPSLPPRPSREQAQHDLEEYAAKRGWQAA